MQPIKKGEKYMKKILPDFNKMSYEEEAEWWDTHDTGDYKLKKVEMVFDLKKPREETLVVRLQKEFKERLERVARSKGLNVSTLARMWLLEKLQSTR